MKETCAVFRHMILDDDVRVEFSKAHDHARAIASDVLAELTELLPGSLILDMKSQFSKDPNSSIFEFAVHEHNKNVLNELILAIAALTVRHEFCVTVEEAGGLKFLLSAMVRF